MIASWNYVEAHLASSRGTILEQLSPEVRAMIGTYKEIEFYPITHWCEVLRGIASLYGNDEAAAERELAKCGEFIAHHATGTFLRLIMKVLTPTLFAKKIPSLWTRDNTKGEFAADLSEVDNGRMVFRLSKAGGLDYIGPVAKGWVNFAMKTMGRPPTSIKLSGWSLAQPGPDEIEIEILLPQ